MNIYTIDADAQGRRLDNFLIATTKSPKSLIYRLIRKGAVRVNGRRIKPNYRLLAKDQVKVPTITPAEPTNKPLTLDKAQQSAWLSKLLFEDDSILILDKPSGLASQPGSGIALSAIDVIRQLRPKYPDINLVHRLDRGTSGCLMFGKTKGVIIKINEMISKNHIKKHYLAVLEGRLMQPQITVHQPLKTRSSMTQKKYSVVSEDGKTATTHFIVLRRFKQHTLVQAKPITGRMHQIRAHAKHIGHPIVGDNLYGEVTALPTPLKTRLYLHARKIAIPDPHHVGEHLVQVKSKTPNEFKEMISYYDHK